MALAHPLILKARSAGAKINYAFAFATHPICLSKSVLLILPGC